jgi:hypothetical protein
MSLYTLTNAYICSQSVTSRERIYSPGWFDLVHCGQQLLILDYLTTPVEHWYMLEVKLDMLGHFINSTTHGNGYLLRHQEHIRIHLD